MKYLIIFFPILTLGGVIHENLSATLMSRIRQKTVPVTEYMARQINKHSSDLQKRGFIGNIKQQLKEYINKTYTEKATNLFEPIMRDEMDNGFNQYYRYIKRDVMLTPAQERHRQLVFADWLSKRIDAKFKNHMVSEFKLWEDDHKPFRKRTKKLTQETSMKKRYVEKTEKNLAIFTIITSFLLIPVFMNPFTIGVYGFIMSIAAFMLVFNPILSRITFGEWL